jgi:alkylhydroperoxidase family enzyme
MSNGYPTVCIDMHRLDARAEGEEPARLYGLGAWRESPLYDDRERAATDTWNRLQIATRALPGNYRPADRQAAGATAAGASGDGADR